MKFILTPNPDPPFNLRRISLPYDSRNVVFNTEDDLIQRVIRRNKQVGYIPCESEAERTECLNEYAAKHPNLSPIILPPPGPHYVVDEIDRPGGEVNAENDYFFDGWEWLNNRCKVNMPKARIIHMDRIRVVRNAELVKLDVAFMRAIEAGDVVEQQRIAALKQELRDIPQTFDLSSFRTPNTLRAAWPQGLPR